MYFAAHKCSKMKSCLLLFMFILVSAHNHAQCRDSSFDCITRMPRNGEWNQLCFPDLHTEARYLIIFTTRRTIIITNEGDKKPHAINVWFPQDAYAYLFNDDYTMQGNASGKYKLWPVFDSAGRIPSAYYIKAANIASEPGRYFDLEDILPVNYLPILYEGIKTYPWLMGDEEFKLVYHSILQQQMH